MSNSRHTFTGADTDTDAGSRDPNKFDAALNCSLEPGALWPVTGNVLVPGYTLPTTGTTRFLGGLPDGATGTAVHLLYNSAGKHRIVRYDPTGNSGLGSQTTLLEWAGLNLAADLPIGQGVNGFIIDSLLSYRDKDGELRCVNLARAANGGYTTGYLAAEPYALHLAKVPPTTVLLLSKLKQSTGASGESLRLIQSVASQFSYRYRYVDNELTVLAPYSAVIDVVDDPAAVTFNVIALMLPAFIPAGVLEIELCVRTPETDVWNVIDTLRRNQSGSFPASYNYYGQLFGTAVTDADSVKQYESLWPCRTGPTLARSRPHAADFLEGYPTPQPAFTATAVAATDTVYTTTVYQLKVTINQTEGDTKTFSYYYVIKDGTYPDPSSTYYRAAPDAGQYVRQSQVLTYDEAFNFQPSVDEASREVVQIPNASVKVVTGDQSTFHEASSYPVSIQFYDALGRPFGAAKPVLVPIPVRVPGNSTRQAIQVQLTTTNPAQLNVEIPPQAYTYQWLVGANTRTSYFLQGQAADVLAYLGQKIIQDPDTKQTIEYSQLKNAQSTPHEKVFVDIGNMAAAGLGYVWRKGSNAVVRFPKEGVEFVITGQRDSYLELVWNSYPMQSVDSDGSIRAIIEIYEPTVIPSAFLFERGPRLAITRTVTNGVEQRGYSQVTLTLGGDCFLLALNIPGIDRDTTGGESNYDPPTKVNYVPQGTGILVESMVPRYRLAPTSTKLTTTVTGSGGYFQRLGNLLTHAVQAAGDVLSFNLAGAIDQIGQGVNAVQVRDDRTTTVDTVNTADRDSTSLRWLDPTYGGRPALVIPQAQQQVRRPALERFGGQKQNGNRINGLSRWDALNQYDKLPQEDGAVTALVLADPGQSSGKVLLALQQHGAVSMYLGQNPIQLRPDDVITSQTNQVIGGDNDLAGAYGCVDVASIATHSGKVFYWCREKQDVIRYNNGLTRLGLDHHFVSRLQSAAQLYGAGSVRGCFDPRREEYWLTFDAVIGDTTRPGLTLIWSELYEAWSDELSWHPEAGFGLGNELITARAGISYRHTPTAPYATFGGVYTDYWVRATTASPDDASKRWMGMEQRTEGSVWNATSLTTDTGQASRTRTEWWTLREGVWRLAEGIRRNELTPSFTSIWPAIHEGHPLVSPRLTWTLTGSQDNPQPLSSVVITWQVRAGQGSN